MLSPVGRWAVLILSVGFTAYGLFAYFFLNPGTTAHPAMQAAYAEYPGRILLHVAFGALALLTGPTQFFPGLRKARPRLHRRLGYLYFLGVLVGGAAGLMTAAIAFGGLVSVTGFGTLAMVWLWTGGAALAAAWRRNWVQHERWALRSFALTFSAVTLRLHLAAFLLVGESFVNFYPVLAWVSWVPNLLFVEWVLLAPGRMTQAEAMRREAQAEDESRRRMAGRSRSILTSNL